MTEVFRQGEGDLWRRLRQAIERCRKFGSCWSLSKRFWMSPFIGLWKVEVCGSWEETRKGRLAVRGSPRVPRRNNLEQNNKLGMIVSGVRLFSGRSLTRGSEMRSERTMSQRQQSKWTKFERGWRGERSGDHERASVPALPTLWRYHGSCRKRKGRQKEIVMEAYPSSWFSSLQRHVLTLLCYITSHERCKKTHRSLFYERFATCRWTICRSHMLLPLVLFSQPAGSATYLASDLKKSRPIAKRNRAIRYLLALDAGAAHGPMNVGWVGTWKE